MNLPTCCFCAEPVLELRGQFARLVPYVLTAADDDLRAAGAIGTCHVPCLLASGWGPRWAERRVDHARQVLRLPVVGRSESAIALRNVNMRETQLFWADGQSSVVADRQLDQAEPTVGGVLLPVEEEYNMELSPHTAVVTELREALERSGRYPLPRLYERLGIAGRVAHANALSLGALVLDEELHALWEGAWVSARVRYSEFVPEDGYMLALKGASWGS